MKKYSIDPNYAEAFSNMGNAYRKQGDLKKAIVSFEKALSINPHIAEAFYNIGIALQEQKSLKMQLKLTKML